MLKRVRLILREIFKDFLRRSFIEKFLITYIGCWISFLSIVLLSKLVISLSPLLIPSNPEGAIKTVEYIAVKKFETLSSTLTPYIEDSYLYYALSYFLNNSISCIVIFLAYVLVAYLYRGEVERDPKAQGEYIDALMLLYLVTVLNPLTGILGYRLSIEHLVVVVPHGLLEFAGLALSIVTGLTVAERIVSGDRDIFSGDVVLKIFIALILIGLAALLEPIDWMIYYYSLYYNQDILRTLVETYLHLGKFLSCS
ncbi:MAG TPA: hypothetical protein EYH15_05125 [Methanothermococcus okinawensis]|uniref:Stage II sporulation protein M n=1 Tax=Methanothermococcus okinawensis TaxID=155863 RepID=A0A832Z8R1_9EURY|nr:hypothetical protein [Methanococcaceae archaeon]HIP84852.1 hypothetical protein [Methanothermococcus okinawensis]HIP90694.1 hypothetical protein [Methanothermococcus okinawensis]